MEEEKPIAITLLYSPTRSSGGDENDGHGRATEDRLVSFTLPSLDSGVDLCAIGRLLGMDPRTVRLNGHFLSIGSDGVSSVAWRALLSAFSAHGCPTGTGDGCRRPIGVQGKLLTPGSKYSGSCNSIQADASSSLYQKRKSATDEINSLNKRRTNWKNETSIGDGDCLANEDSTIVCLKRKSEVDKMNPLKKKRTDLGTQVCVEDGDNLANEDGTILCLKRKLRLDDESQQKKRKSTNDSHDAESRSDVTRLVSQSPDAGVASRYFGGLCKCSIENDANFIIPLKETK